MESAMSGIQWAGRLLAFAMGTMVLFALALPAQACTLFAAQGTEFVQGGGTLLVKNRDWKPESQRLLLRTDKGRYRFYGLYCGEKGHRSLRGGVNEAGVAIVSASASSIPKTIRHAMPQHGVLTEILAGCGSVEEALAVVQETRGPNFLMLADAKEIAIVEVGRGDAMKVRIVRQGTAAHTNHYLDPAFADLNIKKGTSSHMRYNRIAELLRNGEKPFSLDDFLTMSADQNDGPDNSIWRTGSTPTSEQTLATMAFHLQEGKAPEIYVKYRREADEQGAEKVERFTFPAP